MELISNLLFGFRDRDKEAEFGVFYVEANVRFMQAFLVLAAIVYYIFFIWDDVIDLRAAGLAHVLRGLVVAPLLVLAALVIRARWARPYIEAILLFVAAVASVTLSFIYTTLHLGFDYGAAGLILVMVFSYALLMMRAPYFIAFSVISLAAFFAAQLMSGNYSPGMLVVNGLYLGTATFLGLLTAGWREWGARERFRLTADVKASRDRIEELLHSMLPRDIVRRMQSGERTIADAHGDVSIVFADLVGFTELSRRISPGHLVDVLNQLFTRFDEEAARHGVEKIKTIGDAYMAVAGLSSDGESEDHAARAADFALRMQAIVDDLSKQLGLPLDIRVGLHVGSVVAGVIGSKRPAFDCWGESVNLASRLEHSAIPGGILISESAYWRLRSKFTTQVLDDLDLKGVGATKVYLLTAA